MAAAMPEAAGAVLSAATLQACAGTDHADEGACAVGVGPRSIQSNTERRVFAAGRGGCAGVEAAQGGVPAVGMLAAPACGAGPADAAAPTPRASAGPEDAARRMPSRIAPRSVLVRIGPVAGCRAAATFPSVRVAVGDVATGLPVAVPSPGNGFAVPAGMRAAPVPGMTAAGSGGPPPNRCSQGEDGWTCASIRACIVADVSATGASASVGNTANGDGAAGPVVMPPAAALAVAGDAVIASVVAMPPTRASSSRGAGTGDVAVATPPA